MAKNAKTEQTTSAAPEARKQQPDKKQLAVKYLQSKGYAVELSGGAVMGNFITEADYNSCKKVLIDKFSENKKEVPFSFGGRIGAQAVQQKTPHIEEMTTEKFEEDFEQIEDSEDE